VFIARGAHGAAIERDGLRVESPDRTVTASAPVIAAPEAMSFQADDVALVAVKSQDTVTVLDALVAAAGPRLPVVCLQNGVNNEREALRRFERVYGATVMCPSVHLQPGTAAAYSGPTTGIIDVGIYPAGVDDVAGAVSAALASSTFSSVTQDGIARWKWRKLITNLGNAIEAVCGPPARRGPIGEIVRNEAEAVLDAAAIDRVSLDEDEQRRGDLLDVQPIAGEARPGGSSWQSLARKAGAIETDYLNGEIVMLGRLHGVLTPANAALQAHANHLARAGAKPGCVDPEAFLSALDA
jgi:2-dehydropantoate 2-reductase